MANAQKPTTGTRHMDIRYFALSDWVEMDLMRLERVHTTINEADHLTKLLDRTLFYRHVDYMMGHIPPAYSPCFTAMTGEANDNDIDVIGREDLTVHPPVARAAKCELQLDFWVSIVAFTKAHVQVQSNLYLF
jgi:hypothetical protein